MLKKIPFLLAFSLLTGCSGHYYTIPSPDYDHSKYEAIGSAKETASGVMLFGFIPISLNSKIERAVKRIMQDRGGDAVTNITIRERWFWAYILNGYKVDIEATVLKSAPPTAPTPEPRKRR